ncbi:MAG: lipopolysaccharide heptosyltransferase II [Candidatus Zixiibacteriota bacterium]
MAVKIIIRTPNHLGDCIMAMPMVNETREAYPGSTVTVLTPQHLADLFIGNPGIDRVLTIPTEHVHGVISVFKVKEIIAPGEFDLGYILPPSFGAASSFKLGGVKERIGYIADGRRLLLTKPLPLPTPLNSEHRSKVYFDLLRRGAGVSIDYVKPKIFLSENDITGAMKLLGGFGIAESDKYAVLAFRAVAESRRWGTENYTELARRIISQCGIKVVLVGTEENRKSGDDIVGAAKTTEGAIVNLAGKTSLRELGTICSRAVVFVGNDSGPAHLAAAVGAPIVVLSGADDPKETSPMAGKKRMIYREQLECISCVKNKCPLKGGDFMRCMKEITVDMVMSELKTLVQ